MRKIFLLTTFVSLFTALPKLEAQNALVLNGAYIRLNGGAVASPIYLVVNQPQTTGIIRPGGGHIHSENQYNHVRWISSTTTGNFIFPFGVAGTAADYIPFEFNKTTAGGANLTVSTYSTNAANVPLATPVSSMPQSARSIDRFWDIRSTAAATGNLTFRYRGIENTIATCATDTIKAQFWTNPAGPWSTMRGPGNPGVTAGIGTVGSITGQTYFQTTETVWALTSVTISPTITASSSITCNGSNNGTATVTTQGGLGAYTYSWSPSGSTSSTATGLTPGVHTVTVTGANACAQTQTVTINQPPAITLTVNQTQVTCTSNASATVTASGGTPSYTAYAWNPAVSTTNTATGMSAVNYTVTVTDANGCPRTTTMAITANTVAPSVAASASGSLNCTTTSTTVVASTTTAPVSYTWTGPGITGGAGTGTATVNTGGTYNYTVTNTSNGCATSGTVGVTQNNTVPVVTASNTGSLNCATTTVQTIASTTATPVSYNWTGPGVVSGATTASATVNAGGTYNYTVTNTFNNCVASGTVAVTQNTTLPAPTIAPTPTITCTNTLVVLTSTTAGVTYTWSGPGIVSSPNNSTVSVNQVGNYTLTVTNPVNSCTNAVTASVGNNTIIPSTTAVGTQTITCATPSVTLIGSANPSSCTVVWTGGVCAGATSYTATACAPGTYTYIATNPANGCQSAAQVATVVPNSGIPTATVSNTGTITCITTSVQVVSTTTTSPATYTWSGPGIVGAANTPTINVNLGGVYSLTLTNTLNGCTSVITNSVTINNAAVTPTTASSTTITCTNLTSTLTAGAGAGTYTYNWSGPGIVGSNTLSAITSSLGGIYSVTVTNTSNGCVGTQTLSVESSTAAPTGVTTNPTSFTLSCLTPSTTIGVSSTGGTTYTWTAPGTGAILSGGSSATVSISGPGIYSVVATGTNGCSAPAATATMIADVNSPAVTLSANTVSITCTSATAGVTVSPTGTVVISTYSWFPASGISSGSNTTTPTFTAAGTYSCLITAGNGCTTTTFVTVASNTVVPTASTPTIANISCASTSVDIIPVFTPATGLTYTWTGSGITSSTSNSSVTVNQSGTYTVSFVDPVSGCANTATYTVIGNTVVPTLTVTSSSTIGIGCLPTNTAVTLDATTTPSTGVTYTWNTTATTQSISVTAPGVYSVVVTDAVNGCSVSAQYTVINNSTLPNVSAGTNAAIPCGGVTTTVSLNGSSTDPGVTFAWTGPGIVSGAATATAVVNTAGNYTLTVTNPTTGCTSSSTVDVTNSVPTASITPDVTTGFAPLTVNFTNTSTNANTFIWTFGNGASSTLTTTAATSAVYTTGTYTIMMIASSGVCSDTAYAVIVVDAGFSLEVPNVFTPNGDNVNDVFTITSTGVKDITLKIFNRWGQLMYDFAGAKAAWDGVTNEGEKASDGTYFYFIKATGYDGTTYEKNGPVGLFK